MALELTGLVRALGTLTLGTGANYPHANDTTTVGKIVYTWVADPTTTANEVEIGASSTISAVNLALAINAGPTGSGTLWGSATVANPYCTATPSGETVVVYARTAGIAGNCIPTTASLTHGSWGAGTLASGAAQTEDLVEAKLTILRDNIQLNAQAVGLVTRMLLDFAC
jgi:hypothetical protein